MRTIGTRKTLRRSLTTPRLQPPFTRLLLNSGAGAGHRNASRRGRSVGTWCRKMLACGHFRGLGGNRVIAMNEEAKWHWAEGMKFALEAIKMLFLINGAAAVAMLTFIGTQRRILRGLWPLWFLLRLARQWESRRFVLPILPNSTTGAQPSTSHLNLTTKQNGHWGLKDSAPHTYLLVLGSCCFCVGS
jgi:hypothetical protein